MNVLCKLDFHDWSNPWKHKVSEYYTRRCLRCKIQENGWIDWQPQPAGYLKNLGYIWSERYYEET